MSDSDETNVNDTSVSRFSEDDLIVGQLARALSDANSQKARESILAEFCNSHPTLTGRFRAVYHADQMTRAAFSQVKARASVDLDLPEEFDGFVIVRKIDHKGMAEIYEGYEKSLQRRVAIKFVRSGETQDELQKRFEREKQVLARLHHTHIVPIHATGEIEHQNRNGDKKTIQYFVMPYIEGVSLNLVIEAANTHLRYKPQTSIPTLLQFVSEVSLESNNIAKSIPGSPDSTHSGFARSHDGKPPGANGDTLQLRQSWVARREFAVSVVRAIADAADALHCAHVSAIIHSHVVGVVHRDIKPHNIMIEPNGHVWLIDFGLAKFLWKSPNQGYDCGHIDSPTRTFIEGISFQTTGTGGGTPNYMAPERWEGVAANPLTDIWSLGATLYELLTLEKAFKGANWSEIRNVVKQPAKPISNLIHGIPFDLAGICEKAMNARSESRYQSASDLAIDLRRWLNHEPTSVVPRMSPHRLKLWSKRNPHRAWLSAVVLSLLVGLFGMLLQMNATNTAINKASQAIIFANREALQASKRELERKTRDDAIREIEHVQASPHGGPYPGNHDERSWSEVIWENARTLPRMEGDQVLRNAVANSLIDPDATILYDDETTSTEYLTFDSTGEYLVTGGSAKVGEDSTLITAQRPRILHVPTLTWQDSTIDGFGPVAVRDDGVCVALVVDQSNVRQFRLFNVNTSQAIASWTIEGPKELLTERNRPIVTLSPDAKWAVITTKSVLPTSEQPAVDSEITVWEVAASLRRHQCRLPSASSATISPDGKLLAVGTSNGTVSLWEIGATRPFAELTNRRAEVLSLAFGVDCRRPIASNKSDAPGAGWLLAVGDAAGGIVVWELRNRIRRSQPRGAHYETLSLAFTADSSLLFSCGRSPGHVWDVATGEEVLHWDQSNYLPVLALGADGLFASAGSSLFQSFSGLRVQKLVTDRGGRVLRGLRDIPRRVVTSHYGRLVAALTIQFEVGVWRMDGRLLHVFDAPHGPFADNATIAFSPDEEELFCCTGDQAFTWNLLTATVQRSWKVAPALTNDSAWSRDGKHLWFARRELVDRDGYPFSGAGEQVVRIYDLLSPNGSDKPILELGGRGRRCYTIRVGTNGLLVLAFDNGQVPRTSTGECWDLESKLRLWTYPWNKTTDLYLNLTFDGSVTIRDSARIDSSYEFSEARTAAAILPAVPLKMISRNRRWGMAPGANNPVLGNDREIHLFHPNTPIPLVTLSHQASRIWDATLFETQGQACLAWSTNNGHVVVIAIDEIHRRLKSINLAWPDPQDN